jgi:hypothetical protein
MTKLSRISQALNPGYELDSFNSMRCLRENWVYLLDNKIA